MAPLQPAKPAQQAKPAASKQSKQPPASNHSEESIAQQNPPKTKKPSFPVTTQMNIKEMLLLGKKNRKQMQPQAVGEVEDITIPRFLLEHSDIRAVLTVPKYEVSILAVEYSKRHSNVEAVSADYAARKGHNTAEYINAYLPQVLASCVSFPLKRMCAPFDTFAFESMYHEEVCRTLLRNPAIETQQQLDEYMLFQNMHQLKFISISMSQDNNVYSDAREFVRRRQLADKTDQHPMYTRQAAERNIQHKYYDRQNLVQHLKLEFISLEEIEKVSNFKKTVLKEMAVQKQPEIHYKTIASAVLQGYKSDPTLFLANKNLVVDPKFLIIVNNLTDAQQHLIAADFQKFCKYVNVKQVCKSTRPRMTSDYVYQMYVSRTDIGRKLPPFHRMCWIGLDNSDDESMTEHVEPAAVTKLTYQPRQRFEKNVDAVPIEQAIDLEDESSSDTSRTTMILRPQSTPLKASVRAARTSPKLTEMSQLSPVHVEPVVNKTPEVVNKTPEPAKTPKVVNKTPEPASKTPDNNITVPVNTPETVKSLKAALNDTVQFTPTVYATTPSSIPDQFMNGDVDIKDAYEILSLLVSKATFVKEVKNHLKFLYPLNFDILWATHKKEIITNFVHHCWIDDLEQLSRVLEKCPPGETRNKAMEMVAHKMIFRSQEDESFDDFPDEDPPQDISDEVQIIASTSGNVPVATVRPVVKQEPVSQQTYHEDSDVFCLGEQIAMEIIIDDTQSPDDSLIKDLQAGDEETPNAFLNLIKGGTQEDEEEPNVEKYSNQTLQRLRDFEPMASRQLREDKQAQVVSPTKRNPQPSTSKGVKRKFFNNRPGPKSSKRLTRSGSNLHYLDDSESPDPGKETATPEFDQGLNDEFSVFLSSQLNLAEEQAPAIKNNSPKIQTPFALVQSAKVQSEPPAGKFSFLVNLQRVVFVKNVKFELFVHLSQFNLYEVLIDGTSCQPLLNINDQEFSALMQLLNTIEKYEFSSSCTNSNLGPGESFIAKQLDLFFSTQIKFKCFQIIVKDDVIDCFDGNRVSMTQGDVTGSIHPEILQAMSSKKCPLN